MNIQLANAYPEIFSYLDENYRVGSVYMLDGGRTMNLTYVEYSPTDTPKFDFYLVSKALSSLFFQSNQSATVLGIDGVGIRKNYTQAFFASLIRKHFVKR